MTSVLAVYREPFGIYPVVRHLPHGASLAEMRARMPGLPEDFDTRGVICLNGQPVPSALWGVVRPKPTLPNGAPVEVTFHAPPHGGGGDDSGKAVFSAIASIALALTGAWIAGGGLAKTGFSFFGLSLKAGSVAANVLAGGVTLLGNLLLGGLAGSSPRERREQSLREASIQSNILQPNAPIPRVVGTHRVFPPLMCEPLITLDGQNEVAEAVFALSGPHKLESIRVGDADIDAVPGVEYETREGWPGDSRLRLVTRYGRTQSVGTELRGHLVDPDVANRLDVTVAPALALPQPMVYATRERPDEFQIQIGFPQGLIKQGSPTLQLRVPFRVRMKARGSDTWINLPEFHYRAVEPRLVRAVVRFVWREPVAAAPSASSSGWVDVYTSVPGQTDAPATDGWTADSYFYAGSGDTDFRADNLDSTGVQNVSTTREEMIFYLDPAEFSADRYDVEILRGCTVAETLFGRVPYTVNGVVLDLFGYRRPDSLTVNNTIPYSREGVSDTVAITRAVSIWNRHPAPTDDFALLAIRARNVQVENVTILASGYVQDWDGTAWSEWKTTSNPAPHFRDILCGAQNADPVPVELMLDSELVAWRSRCATLGYTCDTPLQDLSVADAASLVAACGFARPYMSEKWGVVQDYDRSAESPVQLFSPRTLSEFSWTRDFARLPDGLQVSFNDAARDYEETQITIYREGRAGGALLEQVTYDGVTSEANARVRAAYELKQPEARGTAYTFSVGADALLCRRGSLIAVQHDTLSGAAGFARVAQGGTTSVVLDTVVQLYNEPDVDAVEDFDAVSDVDILGLESAAVIRRSDGAGTETLLLDCVTGETDVLVFASPTTRVLEGTHIIVGPRHQETRRMIVTGITPKDDFEATITAVDEASAVLF